MIRVLSIRVKMALPVDQPLNIILVSVEKDLPDLTVKEVLCFHSPYNSLIFVVYSVGEIADNKDIEGVRNLVPDFGHL